jgi:FxsC-like protein
MRLNSMRDEYLEFVSDLAEQVIDVAEASAVPPGNPRGEFDVAVSAFHTHGLQADQPETQPLIVHFIAVAGTREAMTAVRPDVDTYGETAAQWSPFAPDRPEPIVTVAQSWATAAGFRSAVGELAALADLQRRAATNNQVIVLLVDPWVLRLHGFADSLTRDLFATDNPAVVAVMVLSGDVSATASKRLFRRYVEDPSLLNTGIDTAHEFELRLPAILEAARNRAFATGRVGRGSDRTGPPPRPMLDLDGWKPE